MVVDRDEVKEGFFILHYLWIPFMEVSPIRALQASTNTTRRCRQCFAVKPIACYINKAGNGLCVICDKCRTSQRRRYHRRSVELQ